VSGRVDKTTNMNILLQTMNYHSCKEVQWNWVSTVSMVSWRFLVQT